MLMITMSDNTASLWLQSLAGTGVVINQWLAAHGFDSTRVNSRTPGREANRASTAGGRRRLGKWRRCWCGSGSSRR